MSKAEAFTLCIIAIMITVAAVSLYSGVAI